MTREIRLGLVGYGARPEQNIGRGRHLLKLATGSFPGVTAAAICEIEPRSLAAARREFPGARPYADVDGMLRDTPLDALLIETPAHLHAGFAVKALARGIHVLSDIPCVDTLDEAWALWKAQRESRAFYMAGANPNFSGWIETALDLQRRGLLGEPYYIETAYIHDCRNLWALTPWRKPRPDAPHAPIQYCTHSLGPVLRLVEDDLAWVSCFDAGSHIHKTPGQHDAMAALFRTPRNVVVRLLISFINEYVGGHHSYRFLTTKGCFERTPDYRTACRDPAEGARTLWYSAALPGARNWIELPVADSPLGLDAKAAAAGHGGLDYAMLAAFFKAVRAGGPSPIPLREGLRMTLPGIYAAESARQGGQLVKIEYPWTSDRPPDAGPVCAAAAGGGGRRPSLSARPRAAARQGAGARRARGGRTTA